MILFSTVRSRMKIVWRMFGGTMNVIHLTKFIFVVSALITIQHCAKTETAAPAQSAPAASAASSAASAPAPAAEEKKNPLDFLKHGEQVDVYNPSGRRDPFKSFEGGEVVYTSAETKAPLERFELNQLDLTAIVWGIARPKVLFHAPDGYSYIAQVGTGIGRNRGKITKISKNRVLINEEFRDPSGQYVARESEFVMDSEPADTPSKLFQEMELKYSDE